MTKIQPEFFFYVSVISRVSQAHVEQRWALRARADENKSTLFPVGVPKVLRGVGEV